MSMLLLDQFRCIFPVQLGPNLLPQRRMVQWLSSIPRSYKWTSTLRRWKPKPNVHYHDETNDRRACLEIFERLSFRHTKRAKCLSLRFKARSSDSAAEHGSSNYNSQTKPFLPITPVFLVTRLDLCVVAEVTTPLQVIVRSRIAKVGGCYSRTIRYFSRRML